MNIKFSFLNKKVLIISFIFILSSMLFAKSNIVRVGVYHNPPKIAYSDSEKPFGIFIDIIEEIAEVEAWQIEYVFDTWENCLAMLSKGEIDLMPDVAYTFEREKIYSFHQTPVLSSWSQAYARKGSNINSILDLNNKTVAVLGGSVQEKDFSHFVKGFDLKVDILLMKNFIETFEAVRDKKASVAITNNFFGLVHAINYDLEDTAIVFNPTTLFFATAKNKNLHLLSAIDKNLNLLKDNPNSNYYKIIKHWTAEQVRFTIPLWIRVSIMGSVCLLLFAFMIAIILKKQVNAKTKELLVYQLELEHKVAERTSELSVAMEKAQQADQLKSAFLATMSHELRTPLNSIIGFTGIIIQELAGPLNDEQKKQLSMVQKSARHLLSLINDILDISKIESGQLKLDYSSFDLKTTIEKCVSVVYPTANKKNIELLVEYTKIIDFIFCDQRRLEQIILNLLSNSVKFTDKGHIKIHCKKENANCVISVIDTGIGMNHDELVKLFKPFSQLDTGLSRKYEGTGLGLSICKKLIELLNGSISVESVKDKGSVFTISFPYYEQDTKCLKN